MELTKPRAQQLFDIDYKQAVHMITTSNVTLSGGATFTVDGIELAAKDCVLVIGQDIVSQHGLYQVTAVGLGTACALDPDQHQPGCVIGKALEDYNSDQPGAIEVVVGRL
jgi:hypothetical protein